MKKIVIFFTLSVLCLSLYSQEKSELAGAWEMTYQFFSAGDSTTERTQFDHPSIKILSDDYFSFCAESGRGHTGKYYYDGKTYTEVIRYSYYPDLVNQTSEFKSKLDGDTWEISGKLILNGRDVQLKETWRRIN